MMRPADYVTREGRPTDLTREAWRERFALTQKQSRCLLTTALLRQLSACRSDEARKLLLGVE